ncbi:50S ribosomal protein L21 [Zhengella mangrovi]|uniref:Large ribosomal subunit protein bL21 n=1 Tax=Zhengella mangrovi TaxID=1982044 RepID=A0A2G1QK60_9HYPH|nr:50S ribosomal protein L21 [Zhengella mangrovi]PHP65882.1 50S ribosomal protein L21 [Zhengella mangrovi]
MFAVIKTGGKQYRVAAEDVIEIERVAGEAGDIVTLTDVLMVGEGASASIGAPFVDGASVAAEIVEQNRGPKVISFKKRRRQNSRRKRGHRQLLTTVRISEILTGGAKPSKAAAPKKAEAPKAAVKEEAAPVAAAAPLFTAPAGEPDDLTKIKGIGPVAKRQLAEQGITQFAQVAALTDEEIVTIDEAMPFSADQIKDWREQARDMAK